MKIWTADQYAKAWEFATIAHQNQSYGGRSEGVQINYINHIGSVAMEVMCALKNTTEILNEVLAVNCALLHDIIEDTEHTYADVATHFGEETAKGVLALTKDESLPTKAEQMDDSLHRIQAQPKEVWMVKLADRICNLYHPPFYWKTDRMLTYQVEAQKILDALGSSNTYLAQRLATQIKAYDRFITPR